MTVYWSDTLRNGVLDAYESTIGTSATLKLWSGTVPADEAAADATASGTVVATYSLASDWMSAASSGAKAFSSLPLSVSAANSGTLTHYRIYASGGTCHEQGSITTTGGGGDMTVDSTSVTAAQTVRVTAFSKTAPHG